MELTLETRWAAGLLLAMIRVAGFVVASPFFPAMVPRVARGGVVIALGLFLAEPIASVEFVDLVAGAATNMFIGVSLGFLTGLILHMFPVGGGIIDMTSGVGAAALVDPTFGGQSAVFSRMFGLAGLTFFYVTGGLLLVVRGLATSIQVIALDGGVSPHEGLAELAVSLSSRLLLAGLEIALPAVGVLFLIEVVMGLASRFAPQANVFLLGLPIKILASLSTVGTVILLFPEYSAGMNEVIANTFRDALVGLRS